jgi:hypothetical protein
VRTRKGSLQGYNAQAVVTEQQIVVAAELTQQATDLQQLPDPARRGDLRHPLRGCARRPGRSSERLDVLDR